MKEIEIKVQEHNFYGERVGKNGEFLFDLFAVNDSEGEIEDALEAYAKLYVGEIYASLHITVDIQDVFNGMYDDHKYMDNKVAEEYKPKFDAFRKSCQSIIDKIDKLEYRND